MGFYDKLNRIFYIKPLTIILKYAILPTNINKVLRQYDKGDQFPIYFNYIKILIY